MRRNQGFLQSALLMALTAGVVGCASGSFLRAGGPFADTGAPNEGIRYYAAKDLLVVEVRKVSTLRKFWKLNAGRCQVAEEAESEPLFATSTVTVADRQQAFRLGLRPTGVARQSMTIGVSEAGLLTGINYTVEDKRAEVIGNSLRAVASLAGTIAGLGLAPPDPTATSVECFARNDPAGGKLKIQIDTLEAWLKELDDQRLVLARRAPTLRIPAELALLRAKDSLLARVSAQVAERYTVARAAFVAGGEAFARAYGIGTKVDTLPPRRFTFDVASLPSTRPPAAPTDDWQRLLYDSAGLVITVEDAPASSPGTSVERSDTSRASISCEKPEPATCARIQYRMPRLRRVTVHGKDFKPLESSMMLLASSTDPILNIGFDAKRIGSGSVKLAFGKYGNISSIEQVSEATAATTSATFVKALADSRADFQEGLKSVAEAQKTLIGIDETSRAARIKELQDQKTLLESEMAIQGSRASRELTLQKQQLDAEIALLTSQQAVAAKTASPAVPNPVQVEIDALKLQIELLQAQIEVEKTRRELEAARRPPTAPLGR